MDAAAAAYPSSAAMGDTRACMADEAIAQFREDTRTLFYHGYDNYMQHAFPRTNYARYRGPLTRDRQNPAHIEVNDVLGNYSLTLIDSLSPWLSWLHRRRPPQSPNKSLVDFQDGIKLLIETYAMAPPRAWPGN